MQPRRNFYAVPFLMLILLASTLAGAQRFVRAPVYSAGNPSLSVAGGDFNGDGNADLAFLSSGNPAVVTIRLGTGNGKFNSGQQITLGQSATTIIAADLNNDGVLDLAASGNMYAVNPVSLLLGKGDGTFTLSGTFDTGTAATSLATGDLNGDGIADIVATGSVLLGLGDGKFGSPLYYQTQYPGPSNMTVADVNVDGRLDIVVVGQDGYDGYSAMQILTGNGDGTFAAPAVYTTTYGAGGNPVVADLNHDGILDVVVGGDLFSVYLGRGDGTFNPQVTYPGTPDFATYALAAADLNKDGNLDLIAPDVASNLVAVLLGNGDGTFKGASLFGTGPLPESLAVADFNKDGNLDIALPDSSDNNFVELTGDGTGKFSTRRDFAPVNTIFFAYSVAAGYLDGDKYLDLAVVAGTNLLVYPGNKNGAFRVGSTYSLSGEAPTWATIADLNADGKNDVATADTSISAVGVFAGNGNGTLQNEVTYATGAKPVFVAAVDVNGDGKLDLLTANTSSNTFSVLLASGSGYLAHLDYTANSPRQLAFGDLNGDGKIDVVSGGSSGTARVFLNNGDGTFSLGALFTAGGSNISPAVGDINNDGKLDVVLTNSGTSLIYSFLGNGDGTFGPQITSAAPSKTTQLLLGDFDADGKLDALIVGGAGTSSAAAALLPGKGDGTFRAAQNYTTDDRPYAGAIGDFNSDGFLDAAIANGAPGTVSVLLNTGAK